MNFKAPSYFAVCVFGAMWHIVVTHNPSAAILCVILAGLFKLGEKWTQRTQTWITAAVIIGAMIAIESWIIWTYWMKK